jgi:large subunit ribosomal protein L15
MSARKKKKIQKKRGHRTCSHGGSKKHRNKGSQGGKGRAGSFGHNMTYLLKYEPGHLGSKGFKSKTGRRLRTINLRSIVKLAGKEKSIDLESMGYDKVLAAGEITKPLEVKAASFSAMAKDKIEKAGGKAIGEVAGQEPKEKAPAKENAKAKKKKEGPAEEEESAEEEAEESGEEAVLEEADS